MKAENKIIVNFFTVGGREDRIMCINEFMYEHTIHKVFAKKKKIFCVHS